MTEAEMQRVVRGFWGPREESVEALAGRWKATLDQLASLLPSAGAVSGAVSGSGSDTDVRAGAGQAWVWRNIAASGPTTDVRSDEASLAAALRAAQEADGWSDRAGTGLRLVSTGEPGWKISVSGLAGGTSEYLLQSMVIEVGSPDDVEVPDAELLTVVAELWEPDFGGVTGDDVLDALEDDADFAPDEPCVGWIGYLSPGRAALLPDSMTGARKEVRGGGVLLDVAASDDVEDVVQANVRLKGAGALQRLPRPMNRAAL